MKVKQDKIYFMDGPSRKEAESSLFVERLLKKGYEVIYLTESVDEYCIQALPKFAGKWFQNVAKEGVKFDENAVVLFETLTLQSGYLLPDTKAYGDTIGRMSLLSLNIDPEAQVEEEPEEASEDNAEDTTEDS